MICLTSNIDAKSWCWSQKIKKYKKECCSAIERKRILAVVMQNVLEIKLCVFLSHARDV